jgi:hypothetical protein
MATEATGGISEWADKIAETANKNLLGFGMLTLSGHSRTNLRLDPCSSACGWQLSQIAFRMKSTYTRSGFFVKEDFVAISAYAGRSWTPF